MAKEASHVQAMVVIVITVGVLTPKKHLTFRPWFVNYVINDGHGYASTFVVVANP